MNSKRQYLRLPLLAAIVLLSLTATLHAQSNKKVKWRVLDSSLSGDPGGIVMLKVEATIDEGWHMYTTAPYATSQSPQSTEVTVGEKNAFTLGGKIRESKSMHKFDSGFEITVHYWEKRATITIPVRISRNARPGKVTGWVNFYYAVCDERSCLPASETKLTFDVRIRGGAGRR
jgi:DsbC/DsbD-like thiol-disulfide interchange protein